MQREKCDTNDWGFKLNCKAIAVTFLHKKVYIIYNALKGKYTIGDYFFTAYFMASRKPFLCSLSKTPCSQSMSCCLYLCTQPEAPCLLKTCLFTSRAQQVSEQSARQNCSSHCSLFIEMMSVSPQNTLLFLPGMWNFLSSMGKKH